MCISIAQAGLGSGRSRGQKVLQIAGKRGPRSRPFCARPVHAGAAARRSPGARARRSGCSISSSAPSGRAPAPTPTPAGDRRPTPSRSAHGRRLARDRLARRVGQPRCTAASSVARRERSRSAPSATRERARARGGSCRRRSRRQPRDRDAAPSSDRRARATSAASAPGHVRRGRSVVITLWPPARSSRRRRARRVGVELAHHVVEQHQRRRLARRGERLALGQQQREQAEALLALRAVGAQLAAVARAARGRRGAGRGR